MFNSCYGTGGNFMRPSLSMVQDKACLLYTSDAADE